MARQLDERFRTGGCFTDLGELLEGARPDVVHVTTPPESHFGSPGSASSAAATSTSRSRSRSTRGKPRRWSGWPRSAGSR